jgi:hypothetical protein
MTVPVKLGAFALALAAALGVGAAIGEAAGPLDVGGDDEHVVDQPTDTTAPHDEGESHFGGHG